MLSPHISLLNPILLPASRNSNAALEPCSRWMAATRSLIFLDSLLLFSPLNLSVQALSHSCIASASFFASPVFSVPSVLYDDFAARLSESMD